MAKARLIDPQMHVLKASARIGMQRGLAVDKSIAPEHTAGNNYDGVTDIV